MVEQLSGHAQRSIFMNFFYGGMTLLCHMAGVVVRKLNRPLCTKLLSIISCQSDNNSFFILVTSSIHLLLKLPIPIYGLLNPFITLGAKLHLK